MPMYEYRCVACGKEFEELVMNGGEIPHCPACGAEHPERLLSGFAVGEKVGYSGSGGFAGNGGAAAGCGGSGGFT